MLSEKKIKEELKRLGVDIPVVFYDTTDSTNTRAKEYARTKDSRTPTLFIANAQSGGRGRMGRSFVSREGAGIYMSLLLYPDERGFDATRATAKAAVALSRAIDALAEVRSDIKWINDIYLGGKKLAGILCEGEVLQSGEIGYLVVGMGINVYKNAISGEISDIATSIESEAKRIPDRSELAAGIVKEMLEPRPSFFDEYKSRSMVIGRTVRVVKPDIQFDATVLDLNEDFSLTIEHNGKRERLFTGEVSLKI